MGWDGAGLGMECGHLERGERMYGVHLWEVCLGCGKRFRAMAQSGDADPGFIWPIGKHRGKRLGDLPPSYLAWAATTLSGNLRRRSEAVLRKRKTHETHDAMSVRGGGGLG
jgi:hypothetical protein